MLELNLKLFGLGLELVMSPPVRSVVLCISSTRTNEHTGEDLCAGYLNGRDKKGMFERLGMWSEMIG